MAKKKDVGRRGFLRGAATGAAVGAAGLIAKPPVALAQRAAEKPEATGGAAEVSSNTRCGADFMVDVIKSLGIEYCAANPGTSFRGLHEAVINYGNNKDPEFLTCLHEESSVALAHGYAKIEGKPMMIMAHGTVGLQHASMAIYNAYADRVPVYIILGNLLDINYRRGSADWYHSVQDAAAMVRDYTKWDDTPVSLSHFAESAVRAYNISMTPPYEPIVIVADGALQEEPITEKNLRIPKLVVSAPPQGDTGAVMEAAKLLVAAENPVIVAGRCARTPRGIDLLVELAELLQCRVQDQRLRMNFPSMHPLYAPPLGDPIITTVGDADVVLGLEAQEMWTITHKDGAQQVWHGVRFTDETRRKNHQHLRNRAEPQGQLSGLRPLRRSRPEHHGRCGSHSARFNRSRQETPHRRPPHCPASARREGGRGESHRPPAQSRKRRRRVRCQPHLDRAPGRRDLEPGEA
jgi:hypothetical protein